MKFDKRLFILLLLQGVLATTLSAAFGALASGPNTELTGKLTAAQHEVDEGHFALGDGATLTVKPGSDLFQFLSAHNGQVVRVHLEVVGERTLEKLEK